VLSKLRKK